MAGDFNIHVERADDPHARQLLHTFEAYGLNCAMNSPTHTCGGTLDLVITRSDLPTPSIDIIDADLSDHKLLRWVTPLRSPTPVYRTATVRPWSRLNHSLFRDQFASSALCHPDCWDGLDVHQLISMYDSETTWILDQLIPFRNISFRRRPSDPWFDEECRAAKREVRRLERRYRHFVSANKPTTDIAAAWKQQLHSYKQLLRQKRESFWCHKVDSEAHNPKQLWRSIDALLGRGRPPPNDFLTADDLHRSFDDKVMTTHSLLSPATEPVFVTSPPDCLMQNFDPLSAADIKALLLQLPNKQSSCDPLPTQLLKENVDIISPFLTTLFNLSLSSGEFPAIWKTTEVTPVLKKGVRDPSSADSY